MGVEIRWQDYQGRLDDCLWGVSAFLVVGLCTGSDEQCCHDGLEESFVVRGYMCVGGRLITN